MEAKFVIPFRMIKTPPKKHKESLRKNTKWSVAKRKERTLADNMQTRNNKLHDIGKYS